MVQLVKSCIGPTDTDSALRLREIDRVLTEELENQTTAEELKWKETRGIIEFTCHFSEAN